MILNNLTHIVHKNSDLFNNPYLLAFLFLFGINSLVAQSPHCHADEMFHQHLVAQNAEHEFQEYLDNLKNIEPTRDGGNVMTIPVVVHIIHRGESVGTGTNLSDAKILEQIQILNDDFNQLNTDQHLIPTEFVNRAANVEIEFCLAKTDPSGNATSGITRTQYGNINSISFIENNIKPQTQWDPTRYMNVWTLRMPSPAILGYAYLPSPQFLNTSLDGVVISDVKIGNQNTITKGRTLVHEVGHYLGLPHLWGSTENDCNEDDQISDTPLVSIPYYGHPIYPQFTCGTSDMFMNFMDYVNDNCMHLFTEGQRTVMRSVVSNQRISLLNNNSSLCNTTVSTANTPALNDLVTIFPNPSINDFTLTVPDNQSIKQVSVFDNSGKIMEFQSFSSDNNLPTRDISTPSLENGMYILHIETYSGETYAKRFVRMTN